MGSEREMTEDEYDEKVRQELENYDPENDPEFREERRQDPTLNEAAADLDLQEYERQWEAFDERWRAHPEVAGGSLYVQQAVLRREPPRVVLGRDGTDELVTVALGREQAPVTFRATATGEELSLPAAARTLGIHPVEMDDARAAILDGLEQSERAAGRTPADRALSEEPTGASTRERNRARMDGATRCGIQQEEISEGPRRGRKLGL